MVQYNCFWFLDTPLYYGTSMIKAATSSQSTDAFSVPLHQKFESLGQMTLTGIGRDVDSEGEPVSSLTLELIGNLVLVCKCHYISCMPAFSVVTFRCLLRLNIQQDQYFGNFSSTTLVYNLCHPMMLDLN